jgi:hypothetical protein
MSNVAAASQRTRPTPQLRDRCALRRQGRLAGRNADKRQAALCAMALWSGKPVRPLLLQGAEFSLETYLDERWMLGFAVILAASLLMGCKARCSDGQFLREGLCHSPAAPDGAAGEQAAAATGHGPRTRATIAGGLSSSRERSR